MIDIFPVEVEQPSSFSVRTGVPGGHHAIPITVTQVAVYVEKGSRVVGDFTEKYETAGLKFASHGLGGESIGKRLRELDSTTTIAFSDD